jgi:hypothetical protein
MMIEIGCLLLQLFTWIAFLLWKRGSDEERIQNCGGEV